MRDIDEGELRVLLPKLRRFALGLARDRSSADDLVQSCMEQALEKYGSRNADGSLYSWLCAILYRQFLDGKRASARINRWLDVMRGVDAPSAPSAQDAWEQRAALDRLSLLPADQRAVLLLVSVEGMSYRDIATTLDLPLGTVMSRLSRARQAFRAVTDYDEQPSMLRIVR